MFLNKQQVSEEITRKIKNFLETNVNENMTKLIGCNKSSSKRVYSNIILPQETRKTSNRQSNFTPKTTGRRRTTTTIKISRRKEIIKIWAEINEKRNERNNSKD